MVSPEPKVFSVLTGFLSDPPQGREIREDVFTGNYFFHPDLQRPYQRLSRKGLPEKVDLTWGTREILESGKRIQRRLAGSFPGKGPCEP